MPWCKGVFGACAQVIANPLTDPDPEAIHMAWPHLTSWLSTTLGCADDIEGILLLVGIQETQQPEAENLSKQARERLIMEGAYCVFETLGYYQRVGQDADGFWIWEPKENLPTDLAHQQQEYLLKAAILRYFDPYMK
ncbi:MAG: hypothetical protein OXU68_03440 [Bacteroidota bacterium]|nr:hypothetical protein [Bacteroidota bacterium]